MEEKELENENKVVCDGARNKSERQREGMRETMQGRKGKGNTDEHQKKRKLEG